MGEPLPGPVTRGTSDATTIVLTPAAAEAVRKIAAGHSEGGPVYLRVRAVAGGCVGFQHKIDLDFALAPGDHLCQSRGVEIVVAERQGELLRGSTVDFLEENGEWGFKVDTPNLKGEAAMKWLPLLPADGEPR